MIADSHHPLNKNPVPCVGFPELFWYAKLFAFKDPVEVGDIVEPAFIGDLGNCICSIYQQA